MTSLILAEIRTIRDQHAASLGYDLDRIYADLKLREAQHVAEGWKLKPPPTKAPPRTEQRLQRTRFDAR